MVSKVFRWLVVAIAVVSIFYGVGDLLSTPPDATIVNQQTGGNVTQEQINENENSQKQGSLGVVIFWVIAGGTALYFEQRSVDKDKTKTKQGKSEE